MNANELADYVDAREISNPHLKEAAIMLRQQQSEIEALKEKLEEWKIWGEEVKSILEKVTQEK